MLDAILFRTTAPYLAPFAARLSASVSASLLSGMAFVAGAAALPAIGFHKYWVALGLLILRAVLDSLAEVTAGATSPAGAGQMPSRILDLILGAALPFAFALAMPERALAAMFLMLGMVVRTGVGSTVVEGKELIGKTELFVAFALACIFPDRFSIIAYVLGVLCFVGAGRRMAQVAFP